MEQQKSKVAIITGAGSGIGRACALKLGALGWNCTLVGRTRQTLDATAEACGKEKTCVVQADLTDPVAPGQIVERTRSVFGRVDAVINNAGYASFKPFHEFTEEDLRRTFEVNTLGPIRLMIQAWDDLAASGAGRIVNVSSYATLDPFSGLGVYGAAKAALNLMGKVAMRERGKANVMVFTVAPGAVETGMLRQFFSEDVVPRSKALDPAEVASVIVACATGMRDYESGGLIPLASP
ncbi:MAG: SDR family oxidoreductase [Planctomycetota bacterium]|nr:MAG: SDR family oxidoreductase [Planctomycetota bacterium]